MKTNSTDLLSLPGGSLRASSAASEVTDPRSNGHRASISTPRKPRSGGRHWGMCRRTSRI
ncbi:MAG: hypothetical protein MZV64_10395 [Ignavibacteriales bacterium]|nr:hypothetical protein [Ignavibacteriales bacterium]